jgi:hypothetical protein
MDTCTRDVPLLTVDEVARQLSLSQKTARQTRKENPVDVIDRSRPAEALERAVEAERLASEIAALEQERDGLPRGLELRVTERLRSVPERFRKREEPRVRRLVEAEIERHLIAIDGQLEYRGVGHGGPRERRRELIAEAHELYRAIAESAAAGVARDHARDGARRTQRELATQFPQGGDA